MKTTYLLIAICLFSAGTAGAVEVVVPATSVGYIRRVPGFTAKHFAVEGHLTGVQGNGILHTENNSYFVFDLSSVTGTITAATFKVYTSNERADVPEGGYWSSGGSEAVQLHEVSTSPATLMGFATTQFNVGSPQFTQLDAMFSDLADGSLWGSVAMTEAAAEIQPGVVPGQPGGKLWDVSLSAGAVASLNAASGLWALGGTLAETSPPISTTTELIFGGSFPYSTTPGRATPIPQLVLTVSSGFSADFNGDNKVDGGDFLIWQRGLGLTQQSGNSGGDASGNGTVGAEDLALWRSQFGSAQVQPAAASVPEPATTWLVAAMIVALVGACRSHSPVKDR